MAGIVSKAWGSVLIVFGVTLVGVVVYRLFVGLQPVTESKRPWLTITFGLGAIVVGITRWRGGGKRPSDPDPPP